MPVSIKVTCFCEGVTFGAAKHGIVKNVLQILWPLSGSEGLRLKPPDNLALLAGGETYRWSGGGGVIGGFEKSMNTLGALGNPRPR